MAQRGRPPSAKTLVDRQLGRNRQVIPATDTFRIPNYSGTGHALNEGKQDLGWDDLRVPAQNTRLNPSKSEPAFESLINGLFVFKFDTSNADDESVHFVAQMPHSYKEGSDIYPHIHWTPDNSNNGNVYWSFEYTITNIGGTISSTTTDNIIVPAEGELKHQLNSFSKIDGSGLKISHIIICRLTRKSTSQATDTFTGNAGFLEFDFHYQKNSIGSRTESSK